MLKLISQLKNNVKIKTLLGALIFVLCFAAFGGGAGVLANNLAKRSDADSNTSISPGYDINQDDGKLHAADVTVTVNPNGGSTYKNLIWTPFIGGNVSGRASNAHNSSVDYNASTGTWTQYISGDRSDPHTDIYASFPIQSGKTYRVNADLYNGSTKITSGSSRVFQVFMGVSGYSEGQSVSFNYSGSKTFTANQTGSDAWIRFDNDLGSTLTIRNFWISENTTTTGSYSVTLSSGNYYQIPQPTNRSNYTFSGWSPSSGSPSCNSYNVIYGGATGTVTAVQSTTAYYRQVLGTTNSIVGGTSKFGGTTLSASNKNKTVSYNQSITLTASPYDGYYFKGWYYYTSDSIGSATLLTSSTSTSITYNYSSGVRYFYARYEEFLVYPQGYTNQKYRAYVESGSHMGTDGYIALYKYKGTDTALKFTTTFVNAQNTSITYTNYAIGFAGSDTYSDKKTSIVSCTSVGSVVFGLDVGSRSSVFSGCTALTTVDFSSASAEQWYDDVYAGGASGIFYGCTNLVSVDVPNYFFENGEGQYYDNLFYNCSKLTHVSSGNYGEYDSSSDSEGDYSGMFYNCSSLEELDISSLYIRSGSTVTNMLYNCTALKKIKCPRVYAASAATIASGSNSYYEVNGSTPYTSISSSTNGQTIVRGYAITYNTDGGTQQGTYDSLYLYSTGTATIGYAIKGGSVPSSVYSNIANSSITGGLTANGILTVPDTTAEDITVTWTWDVTRYALTLNPNDGLIGVTFSDGASIAPSVNMPNVYAEYGSDKLYKNSTSPAYLTAITASKTGLIFDGITITQNGTNTIITTTPALKASVSGYTNSNGQWIYDRTLTLYAKWKAPAKAVLSQTWNETLDVPATDVTSIATWINRSSIPDGAVDVSATGYEGSVFAKFVSGNITFYTACSKIYLPTDSSYIFSSGRNSSSNVMTNLSTINITNFDSSDVTNMSKMFYGCTALSAISGLIYFKSTSLTNTSWMFYNCIAIESLNFGTGFTTENVTKMDSMFANCIKLKNIIGLNNFTSDALNYTTQMFENCSSLESLTFGIGFTTANVTSMNQMFKNCSLLEILDISSFNINSYCTITDMFSGCLSLKKIVCPATYSQSTATTIYDGSINFYDITKAVTTPYTTLSSATNGKTIVRGYCITFNSNGGSAVNNVTYTIEDAITITQTTEYGDNIFQGWKVTSATGNWELNKLYQLNDNISAGQYGDLTLTAQWEATYTLTFSVSNTEYGTVNIASINNISTGTSLQVDSNKITINNTEIIATSKNINGYNISFVNWTGYTATITSDLNIVANFSSVPIEYNITFNSNGGSAVNNVTYTIEDAITITQTTEYGDNIFQGWKVTNTTGNWELNKLYQLNDSISTGHYGDVTLTAQWTIAVTLSYQVKHYKMNLNGQYLSIADDTEEFNVVENTQVTPEVKNYEGFISPTTKTITVTQNGENVVKYYYERVKFTVTWLDYDGTELLTSQEYYGSTPEFKGETPKRQSDENFDYHFAGWTPKVNEIISDATFTAEYHKEKVADSTVIIISCCVAGAALVAGGTTGGIILIKKRKKRNRRKSIINLLKK